jgi:hypothetical protein
MAKRELISEMINRIDDDFKEQPALRWIRFGAQENIN